MKSSSKAILRTLAYADVFDYPLRENEIYRFLISNCQFPVSSFQKELLDLSPKISKKDGFYFLKGRGEIIAFRKKRARWSQKKTKIAQRVANWLKFIPTIKMVAVTGALAMANADKEDDIDLMIVTAKNRLWLTRLLTVLLIEVVASRRRPGNQKARDKICLNMFLDEAHLAIPKKERDLFSAHEVGQMKVLWEKGGIYQKFLKANQWASKFTPNAINKNVKIKYKNDRVNIKNFLILICSFTFYILNFTFIERMLKHFQLWYMRNRRTTEKISKGIVRFHPQDARAWVLPEYQKRLKRLGVG